MTNLFLILTIVALVFRMFPPKKINYLYGYRTSRSMKNIENWNFANQYSAAFMLVSMPVLFGISYLLDYLNFEAQGILIGLLFCALGMMFYLTEKKMKAQEV